jgi:hypothetical protein
MDGVDWPAAIATDPSGARVFAAGRLSSRKGSSDFATVARDATTGAVLWKARFAGPKRGIDAAAALVVSPDGATVYVAGTTTNFNGTSDAMTIAYVASTGARRWVGSYDSTNDQAADVALSPDGARVYVTGSTGPSTDRSDILTIAYDAVTGTQVWSSTWDGKDHLADAARSIGVSPDGSRVYVAGQSRSIATSDDYATVAFDATDGTELWSSTYDGIGGDGTDIATDLGTTPQGSIVYVTGYTLGPNTQGQNFATIAYDGAIGSVLWLRTYNGPMKFSYDVARALAVSPDGTRVFVTGQSERDQQGEDFLTVSYASTGSPLWIRRYDQAGYSDGARGVAASEDGTRVYVIGSVQPSSSTDNFDSMTFAYDASDGAQLWGASYDGPAHGADSAYGVAVRPDGSMVYVAGESAGLNTSWDWATIAYTT